MGQKDDVHGMPPGHRGIARRAVADRSSRREAVVVDARPAANAPELKRPWRDRAGRQEALPWAPDQSTAVVHRLVRPWHAINIVGRPSLARQLW
jgi:hypothetical protein